MAVIKTKLETMLFYVEATDMSFLPTSEDRAPTPIQRSLHWQVDAQSEDAARDALRDEWRRRFNDELPEQISVDIRPASDAPRQWLTCGGYASTGEQCSERLVVELVQRNIQERGSRPGTWFDVPVSGKLWLAYEATPGVVTLAMCPTHRNQAPL